MKDLFKAPPLPVKRPEQTYQPRDHSWDELKFNYRIEIKATGDRDERMESFFRIKEWMQGDPERWGVYRENWFGSINTINQVVYHVFYFMDRDTALFFRLSV